MITHYSTVKGETITNKFKIVNNTVDSLWLPLNHFKKVCIFNTLHEIPAKEKMVRDINKILQVGGEVIVMELVPRKPNELHVGCHKPLLTTEQLNTLFTSNGFALRDKVELSPYKRSAIQMIKYVKN
jgi:ubiquinone/menaquinone biosynthesis C-methylase UbiE